jgi:mRNA interferase MazF
MRQCDIYWADLEPTIGQEQQGTRPVVIISGNALNNRLRMRIVCPLSGQIKHLKGCVVLKKNKINNLDSDSEVIPFQVRSIATARLKTKIGEITSDQLEQIKIGLSEILTY